jgi:hypothetical protein
MYRTDVRQSGMTRRFAAWSGSLLLLCGLIPSLAQQSVGEQVQRNPIIITSTHVRTVVPLRDMKEVPLNNISKVMPEHDEPPFTHRTNLPDAVAHDVTTAPPVSTQNLLNFSGIIGSQGGGFEPPDTNSDVGATQVVETVNLAYAVYNKTNGNVIMAPKAISTLYAPLGGTCGTQNLSDPTATWDNAAQRWVITIIAYNGNFSQNAACVAVSTSADATGTYNLYSFSYGNVLPDYPKLGVWPDAYYLTTDSFPGGGGFSGAESCALNRANMLAGQPAGSTVCFQRSSSDFALLPADLDGSNPPPSGAPNFEMDLNTSNNKLNLYKFHVDFNNVNNSTFTGPTLLTVAAFSDACPNTRSCIPQPSPGERVDAIGNRLMHRLAYRNYGDHEAMTAVHSIAPTSGSGSAASRWYEIRNPNSSPTIFQSGTVVHPTYSVWMGSIAMDKAGDIALGVSASSSALKPTVAYVGRVPSDTLGTMESPFVVIQGTGVQVGGFNRWGDYSSMQVDPADDCTFWYTQMYYSSNGGNWNTRLDSFKFRSCQ